MNDYYAILEVAEDANEQEIKKAYRRLAKIYHPDAVGDDSVKIQRMYDIQEAYQCLIGNYQEHRTETAKKESPICPEELFARFFGNTNKGKGRQ